VSNALPTAEGGPFAGTVINVMDHGAVGDGMADDTAHIRAAIAAADDGGAIYFPPGTYLVSAPLVPEAGQMYFSLGDKAIIKSDAAVEPFSVFKVQSGPVEFHRLTLDLSKDPDLEPPDCVKPKEVPSGIVAEAVAGGTVELVVASCRIRHSHGQGIRVRGSGDERRHDRVVIRDTVVEDCCESGVTLGKVNGGRVEACRFEGCRNGIVGDSCRDVVVSAVTATKNRRHGIVFRFSYDWHVRDCIAKFNGGKERDETKLRGWGIAAGGGPERRTPNNGFTITDNICEDNYAGGITLDPTIADDPKTDEEDESARVLAQRARISGNVCRGRRGGSDMGGDSRFGTHGIHVRNSSNVVVTDNLCHDNHNSGIQVVNCSHVLVQANACYDNENGIGLFSRTGLRDPDGPVGGLVVGVNMLYRNAQDFVHGPYGKSPRAFPGLRLYGLHGSVEPECHLVANPGTLFEWHDERDQAGALYVKVRGSGTSGWVRVETQAEKRCLDLPPHLPIKPT
jgi:parallel beta-helix repeat protein